MSISMLQIFQNQHRSTALHHLSTTHVSSNVNNVSDLRKEYSSRGISELDYENPFEFFKSWFEEACNSNVLEPNAMCLSTCKDNIPTARIVLLKNFDERGFVWFTNYNSRKSSDLISNPRAAVTFWWGDLERSVRIEGVVEKVSTEESDSYFNSRPRNSQIGAWTSCQSSVIESREKLQEQEEEIKKKFEGIEKIPRPEHWGGFRLIPNRMEFWKGRESRLHDRVLYTLDSKSIWTVSRLQP